MSDPTKPTGPIESEVTSGVSVSRRKATWALIGAGVLAAVGYFPEYVDRIIPLVDPKYANFVKLASILCLIVSQAYTHKRITRVDDNVQKVAAKTDTELAKPVVAPAPDPELALPKLRDTDG